MKLERVKKPPEPPSSFWVNEEEEEEELKTKANQKLHTQRGEERVVCNWNLSESLCVGFLGVSEELNLAMG